MNYFELQPENNTFSNIVVDITHKCNMECANCYIPNREIPDLDKDKLYNFLSRLPQRTYIRIIGAEPTMRNDLFEIISTVKKLGHRPSLTTNGLKLAHEPYVKGLKEAGLRLLLHSMNGADEDIVYQSLDNGNWATVKIRALENIFKHRLPINTGTIIARGINEHSIGRQVNLFVNTAIDHNINFDTDAPYKKIKPVLRMKSVGAIGRNLGQDYFYTIPELAKLASEQLDIPFNTIINSRATAGVVKAGAYGEAETSILFPYHSLAGTIYIRLIDWKTNDDGVIDHDNPNRGRLTPNWTVAPFFEHVKANEHGY